MIEKLSETQTESQRYKIVRKLNELIDVVNKQQDIIRQIGEWGSKKGECLWCDTLTEFNPEKPLKETSVSIDEALEMGKQDHKIRSTNERLREALSLAENALIRLANDAYDMDEHIYIDGILNQIERITKGGDND